MRSTNSVGTGTKRLIAVAVFVFVLVASAGEYAYVWWQLNENIRDELKSSGSDIARSLTLSLPEYNVTPVDVPKYFVVASDGTIFDVSSDTKGIIEGVLTDTTFAGDEQPLYSAPRRLQLPSRTTETETWDLYAKKVQGGRVILGISRLDNVSDPSEVLRSTASRLGTKLSEAKAFKFGNEIHFALLSDDDQLISAFGRIPLKTNALALGAQGTGFARDSHRTILRQPFSDQTRRFSGTIIVALDTSVTDEVLRQLRMFKEVEAGVSFLALLGLVLYVWSAQEAQKQLIQAELESHFSPAVARAIVALDPTGERREVAILFSDIKGFTELSARLAPAALTQLLNEYFAAMTEEVHATDGGVDKFIGDAVMAYWPLKQPDIAERAVLTAVQMLSRLEQLNLRWRASGLPEIAIRIGISLGVVTVGKFGSDTRRDYTIIGDAVNVASRLEALNKPLGTSILISDATKRHLSSQFTQRYQLRDMGLHAVDGVETPIRVFTVQLNGGAESNLAQQASLNAHQD